MIGFLILHYQNVEVTETNIDYLQKIEANKNDVLIVVVDNCSPNKSGEKLEEKYREIDNIAVIKTPNNGGFAYGNNFGYEYIKKEHNLETLVILNSDCYIKDVHFVDKLRDSIKKYKDASIIAPDIVNKRFGHQNPILFKSRPTRRLIIGIFKNYYTIVKTALKKRNKVNAIKRKTYKKRTESPMENVMPHGACIIYTLNWLNKENKAFMEGTYLGGEEELLYDYCMHMNHKIMYDPKLQVTHLGGSSHTNNEQFKEKVIKTAKINIRSNKLQLKYRLKYFIHRKK